MQAPCATGPLLACRLTTPTTWTRSWGRPIGSTLRGVKGRRWRCCGPSRSRRGRGDNRERRLARHHLHSRGRRPPHQAPEGGASAQDRRGAPTERVWRLAKADMDESVARPSPTSTTAPPNDPPPRTSAASSDSCPSFSWNRAARWWSEHSTIWTNQREVHSSDSVWARRCSSRRVKIVGGAGKEGRSVGDPDRAVAPAVAARRPRRDLPLRVRAHLFAAGRRWGIRPFVATLGVALNGLVAPLLGLKSFPGSLAMSRALGRLRHGPVRGFLVQLLTADPQTCAVLASPHVRHRDANGQGWHVLDFDPTIEAFCPRGLPDDASLPVAERRAQGTPGYTGHKRGDLRVRHLPLQHAGAAVWLAYRYDATGTRHVLPRVCRYTLFDRAEVQAAMKTASWRRVASAGGGPVREAADLGIFTLHPDGDARDADGGPVEVGS